jgi:Leucine-rich repeat (LRR) protein
MADPGEKLVLKPGVVIPFLSNFSMSNDGESFHFTECDMSNKNIEQLNKAIEEAKEVYKMNLSVNNIADPGPIKELHNLIHLDLSKNKIKNVSIFTSEESFLQLKYLDLSNNKFPDLAAFKCPKLEYLDLSFNKLEKINEGWQGHPNLKVFKVVDNKFKNFAPFKNMPKLEELYLANNNIAALSGYEGLASLRVLHLRRNKIEKIDDELPELPALEYLNLRSNKIPNMENLAKIFAFPNLRDINVINCPVELSFSSMNVFIAEVLIRNTKMQRFCKVEINDSHKLEAVFLAKYNHKKAEDERKRLEEEEKAKAEAEAANEG